MPELGRDVVGLDRGEALPGACRFVTVAAEAGDRLEVGCELDCAFGAGELCDLGVEDPLALDRLR